jgi:hypothetical protein
MQRSQRLQAHAALAPQANSQVALQALAGEEERQARRLREALQSAGAAAPTTIQAPAVSPGENHWRRLVIDLEEHRVAERDYQVLAMRFGESAPACASLFGRLSDEEHTHAEQLRDLIARADPQALD